MSAIDVISELELAIASRSAETHAMMRRMTDLFLTHAGQHSADQLGVYDQLFIKLIEKIEVTARAELSKRLAPVSGAPVNTIRTLAQDDEIEVAGPILAQSDGVDDDTLAKCAASKGPEHLMAIATRLEVSEKVSTHIVERGDSLVLGTLASNPGVKLSDAGFGTLVQKSVGDDWLAECVAVRKDIPNHHFRELISKASNAVQQRLIKSNPELAAIVREIAPSDTQSAAITRSKPSLDYRIAEFIVSKKKWLLEEVVADFARERKLAEVIFSIAKLSGLSTSTIEPFILNSWTTPVAVVLKAIGFHLETLDAIYCARLSNEEAIGTDLQEIKIEFMSLKRATAERILRFYKTRTASQVSVH